MKRVTVVLLLICGMNLAYAGGKPAAGSNYSKWQAECGSCHVPYPPELLTEANWQSLMSGLDQHFGVNAVMDAQETEAIAGFLRRNAGVGDRYSAASLRISDTPWFRREHRSVAEGEWTRAEVQSRSNCSACHGKSVLRN